MPRHSASLQAKLVTIKIILGFVLGLNLLFWCGSRDVYERWSGVPPVPSRTGAVMMTLGDPEFSYRTLAIILQNLGDVGRDVTPLRDYDYNALRKWFFLLWDLDPVSDHVPMVAAYYFGATKVPKDAANVVDFLEVAGSIPAGDKWRWLAQAVYLSQHRMYDMDLALKLAYRLAKMPNSVDMPQWARQMPAFVLQKKGDREAARALMEQMLATQGNLQPAEINTMKYFLINEIGVAPEEVDKIMRMRGVH